MERPQYLFRLARLGSTPFEPHLKSTATLPSCKMPPAAAILEAALRKLSAEGYPRNAPTEIADGERRNDRFNNCAEARFRYWGLRAAAEQRPATGARLHRHPPDRGGRNRRSRANARIRPRPSFQDYDGPARLCAHRHDARRQGWDEVEGEICQRRPRRGGPAGAVRRRERKGTRHRDLLFPDVRGIHAPRAERRGKDHRAVGSGLVYPRELRQRRRGEGQHRQRCRPLRCVRRMGLRPGGALHRARSHR